MTMTDRPGPALSFVYLHEDIRGFRVTQQPAMHAKFALALAVAAVNPLPPLALLAHCSVITVLAIRGEDWIELFRSTFHWPFATPGYTLLL